ncbi:MAG: glucose-6-phosphate isomerase [Nitriliruptoraceae bacterium]
MTLGPLTDAVAHATDEALAGVPRIWARDHTWWADDPTELADRLGWLEAPERAVAASADLVARAGQVRADGITDVVVVGMGGATLYPRVLASTFGSGPGAPRLHVLDSTDPAAVLGIERSVPWERTLVVPASKSGGSIETLSFLDRFEARLAAVHGEAAGRYVLPITDPGSPLARRAGDRGYRGPALGQPDVGGRFSALTAFGLLPAALLGLDPAEHVASAREMLAVTRHTQAEGNAPAVLGAVLAAGVRTGRDKMALLVPDEIASFGLWIEQLIAESIGKHGVGIVPVLGETPANAHVGDDRFVVAIGEHPEVADLLAAGVPVVQLPWTSPAQLAGEVIRWEFATAVAGGLLGMNPFDQPNVQAAKTATDRVLASGADLPATADPDEVLASLRPGDLLGLLAFVVPDGGDEARVRAWADRLRASTGVPVTVGIGPRYLHSTGQLHKGGSDRAAFLLLVGDDPEDVEIPGRPYGFSRLKRAQAAGDLDALRAAGRRVEYVSLDAVAG